MTTQVTITTHDWPVKVTKIDQQPGQEPTETEMIVAPHDTHTVAIWQTMALRLDEMPLPE